MARKLICRLLPYLLLLFLIINMNIIICDGGVTFIPHSSSNSSYLPKFSFKPSFFNWNMSKCCSKISIYVYNIDTKNITLSSTDYPLNLSFENWKLKTNCYFTRYNSLNQLNLPILDWFNSLSFDSTTESPFYRVSSPNEACLVIYPAIPNACSYHKHQIKHFSEQQQQQQKHSERDFAIARKFVAEWFQQFPSWNHNINGSNHLIIDFYDNDDRGPWDSSGRFFNQKTKELEWNQIFPYSTIDVGNAMVIGSNLDSRYYRSNFDLSIPLLHTPIHADDPRRHSSFYLSFFENSGSLDTSPDLIKRVKNKEIVKLNEEYDKKHLICFLGTVYQTNCCQIRNLFWNVAKKMNNSSILYFPDISHSHFIDVNHSSVYNFTEYHEILSECVYGLVLSGKGYHSYRLVELLSMGVIPMVVRHPYYVLPFTDEWKWFEFSLVYREDQLSSEAEIERRTQRLVKEKEKNAAKFKETISLLQRNGLKLYETKIETRKNLWNEILKEIQKRIENEMKREVNRFLC